MRASEIKGGTGADGPYWDALDEGKLRLMRCNGCTRWVWPAHYRCGHCGSWNMEWAEVEPAGTLYTWSRVHYTPADVSAWAGDIPYVVILVELPGADGVRIPGVLIGNESGMRIGAAVEGVFMPPSEKTKGYSTLAWRLADAPQAKE